jgi:NADH-quinone oxidoreductase subunit K
MIDHYALLIGLAVATFAIGLLGVLVRRNLLVVIMCVEIMINAVVLAFVTFAARAQALPGVAMTFFVYVAASCEIAVAMAIVVLLVQRRGTLDMAAGSELKG